MSENKKKVETLTVKPEISFFENEIINRLCSIETEVSLDSKLEAPVRFMTENPGHGLNEVEKDVLYGVAQGKLNEFKKELRDAKFNFHLNRPQYNLLTDLILKKLEYDVNTIFIAIELTDLMRTMSGTKYKNDDDLQSFEMTATEITYVYHLISKYTIKGLSKEGYTFAKLLIRIGELSKVISYYDATAKNLVEDITNWALRMDASDVVRGELLINGQVHEQTTVEFSEPGETSQREIATALKTNKEKLVLDEKTPKVKVKKSKEEKASGSEV